MEERETDIKRDERGETETHTQSDREICKGLRVSVKYL